MSHFESQEEKIDWIIWIEAYLEYMSICCLNSCNLLVYRRRFIVWQFTYNSNFFRHSFEPTLFIMLNVSDSFRYHLDRKVDSRTSFSPSFIIKRLVEYWNLAPLSIFPWIGHKSFASWWHVKPIRLHQKDSYIWNVSIDLSTCYLLVRIYMQTHQIDAHCRERFGRVSNHVALIHSNIGLEFVALTIKL